MANNKNTLDMMMKFAPRLARYGKAQCDLCGGFSNVNDGEVSVVTDAATGAKRYFHICYDCLHKRVDVDDIHNLYSDEEKERWRREYKAVKHRRTTMNTYEDLCLNCFITTNDIKAFRHIDNISNYAPTHKAILYVDEGMDTYEAYPDYIQSIPYKKEDRTVFSEISEFHTTITLRPCDDSDTLKLCNGRGSQLCENCRFRKV